MKTTTLAPVYPSSEITNNFFPTLDIVEVGGKESKSSGEFLLVLQELLSSDHSINTKKAIVSDMKHFY